MMGWQVSVIVPIFNAEAYLEQCLQSIASQTLEDIEIVLVNDGSTDGSPKIIDAFARNKSNVVVVNQQNKGLAEARIAGFNNSHGKYIGWVDADDFVSERLFETLLKLCVETDSEFSYCNYNFHPHAVNQKKKWFKEYNGTIDWHFIDRNTQFWNTLSSRDLLDRIDLSSLIKQYEEYAYIIVMLEAKGIAYTTEELYYYRVGIQSMSGGSQKGKVNKFMKGATVTKTLRDEMRYRRLEQHLIDYFDYRYIYTLLQLAIVSSLNGDRDAYDYAKSELIEVNYRSNPLTKTILDENHGKAKSFVLRNLIPSNYPVARAISRIAMG